MIPVVCQGENCGRREWIPFSGKGRYAFLMPHGEYDKYRMRISRAGVDIEKEMVKYRCPVCGELTRVLVMKKASALRFQELCPEVPMVMPRDMRLPGEETPVDSSLGPHIRSKPDFLSIEKPFRLEKVYSRLIDEINVCYEYEAYSSTLVMLRKLIENLLVDILRMEYAPKDLHEYYFDESKEQFLPLHILVRNLEDMLEDLRRLGLTKKHLGIIKGLRKVGNRAAHSIIDLVDKRKLDSLRSNANKAVMILLRVIGIKKGLLDSKGNPLTMRRKRSRG